MYNCTSEYHLLHASKSIFCLFLLGLKRGMPSENSSVEDKQNLQLISKQYLLKYYLLTVLKWRAATINVIFISTCGHY